MHDAPDIAGLPDDFRQSAAPETPPANVTLPIDADVVAWLQGEFPDWQGHVNGLLRFYMETSAARVASCDPYAFEPGEMAQEPPEYEFA